MEQLTATRRTMRWALAVAMAGATLGLAGAGAMASTDGPASVPSCRANESDLLRAADAARQLEAKRPELFESSSRARFDDLRVAAEWRAAWKRLLRGSCAEAAELSGSAAATRTRPGPRATRHMADHFLLTRRAGRVGQCVASSSWC